MPRPRTRIFKLPKGPGSDLAYSLAANVVTARKAQSLSQADLAQAAGLSFRTLQRVEGPEGVSDLTTLACIAKALQVHPSTLIL